MNIQYFLQCDKCGAYSDPTAEQLNAYLERLDPTKWRYNPSQYRSQQDYAADFRILQGCAKCGAADLLPLGDWDQPQPTPVGMHRVVEIGDAD